MKNRFAVAKEVVIFHAQEAVGNESEYMNVVLESSSIAHVPKIGLVSAVTTLPHVNGFHSIIE
jgi:hypothetical protein